MDGGHREMSESPRKVICHNMKMEEDVVESLSWTSRSVTLRRKKAVVGCGVRAAVALLSKSDILHLPF